MNGDRVSVCNPRTRNGLITLHGEPNKIFNSTSHGYITCNLEPYRPKGKIHTYNCLLYAEHAEVPVFVPELSSPISKYIGHKEKFSLCLTN
jgi:hypothetical protein